MPPGRNRRAHGGRFTAWPRMVSPNGEAARTWPHNQGANRYDTRRNLSAERWPHTDVRGRLRVAVPRVIPLPSNIIMMRWQTAKAAALTENDFLERWLTPDACPKTTKPGSSGRTRAGLLMLASGQDGSSQRSIGQSAEFARRSVNKYACMDTSTGASWRSRWVRPPHYTHSVGATTGVIDRAKRRSFPNLGRLQADGWRTSAKETGRYRSGSIPSDTRRRSRKSLA